MNYAYIVHAIDIKHPFTNVCYDKTEHLKQIS